MRLLLLLCLLGLPSGLAGPAQVILLRHAEKPPFEYSEHLSGRGRDRARALAGFLTTNDVLVAHGLPIALFAPDFTQHRQSRRPAETLAPLAERLHLSIQTPYPAKNGAALANEILSNPAYNGKTVVVCWVHNYLPALAKAFGAKAPGWSSGVYDRVWVITFGKKRPTLVNLHQGLLPGDAGY